jgi:hypothetical protein
MCILLSDDYILEECLLMKNVEGKKCYKSRLKVNLH